VRPISRLAMTAAFGVSWGSMLVHNLDELPLGPLARENARPLLVVVALGLAVAIRLGSFLVAAFASAWGVLNLVVGGIVSVLPPSFLPWVPEQAPTHHGMHVVDALGQQRLVVVSHRAVRRAAVAQRSTEVAR
jgi:hypothetical protein